MKQLRSTPMAERKDEEGKQIIRTDTTKRYQEDGLTDPDLNSKPSSENNHVGHRLLHSCLVSRVQALMILVQIDGICMFLVIIYIYIQ